MFSRWLSSRLGVAPVAGLTLGLFSGCSAGLESGASRGPGYTHEATGVVLPEKLAEFERLSLSHDSPEKGATRAKYTAGSKLGGSIQLFLNAEVTIVPAKGRSVEAYLAREETQLRNFQPGAVKESSGTLSQGAYAYYVFDRASWNDRAGMEVQVRRRGDYLVCTEFMFVATRRDDWKPAMERFSSRIP